QSVTLTATVTAGTVKVNEGTETFTILNGSSVVGSPVTANVVNGAVSATYTVPGGTAVGSDVIEAEYNGTTDYSSFIDSSHSLAINAPTTTAAASTTA